MAKSLAKCDPVAIGPLQPIVNASRLPSAQNAITGLKRWWGRCNIKDGLQVIFFEPLVTEWLTNRLQVED